MGEVVGALADHVVLTNDNPRNEDPTAIAAQVAAGLKGRSSDFLIELDREKAITLAIAQASREDTILIAGKGHEDTQSIGGKKLHFDDRETARRALNARSTKESS